MNDVHVETVKDRKIDLSVCMIVKDEEADIRACIESVREVADEIVILDTGSTDRTVEIARGMGAHVFSAEWENDFARARNQCLAHAGGAWVLFIDADERLTAESRIPLRNEAANRPGGPVVYAVKFLNMTEADKISYVHCAARLFLRLPQVSFTGKLHEQIWDSERKALIPATLRGDIAIEHHGYKMSIFNEKNKTERNEKILRDMIQEDPDRWYSHFIYGRQIVTNDSSDERYRDAIEHLGRAIVCSEATGELFTHSSIYYYMANAHLKLREPEKAIGLMRKSLEMNDTGCDIYFTLGTAYAELKKWDKAIEFFKKAIKDDHIDMQSQLRAHRMDISQWRASLEIGSIYVIQLNDRQKAMDYLKKAELYMDTSPFIAVKLFATFLKICNPEKAAYYMYELRSHFPDYHECLPEHELFEYYMEHEGREDAINFTRRYREKLRKNSSVQFLRLCGDALLNTGEYEEALSLYSYVSDIIDKKTEDMFILQGHCYLKMKRFDEGIECLERGRLRFPDSGSIDNNIAALYMETGDFEKALHHATEALRKSPEYPAARFNLAKIEYNLRHYREALAHLDNLDTLMTDNQFHDDGLFLSAVIYFDLKEHERSIQILNTIIESQPGHLEAYRYLIMNFRAAGNEAVADSLEKALSAITAIAK